jgi:hypothetical protein
VIDWETLIAAPYGASLNALCAHPELVRQGFLVGLYRAGPNQYLDVFEDPANGELKYRGFGWVASEGAARVLYMRQGSARIGVAELPPAILLPKPGMLSVDAIAEYGSRREPATFARYVNLTHQVRFGPFCYHYELITPRPTDAPIAIEIDRDPAIHIPVL